MNNKRNKPEDADLYGWDAFERYADENGIGAQSEDWDVWWDCWVCAYHFATLGEELLK